MKNITKYIGNRSASIISMLFIFAIAISSCSKELPSTKPTDDDLTVGMIKVTGEDAGAATKTTLSGQVTSWVATTDKVGIYSPEARTATGGGGTLGIANAEYTAASTSVASAFTGTSSMYWGAASTTHDFYAYYPWATGTPTSNLVPITLAALQTQSAADNTLHIGALDFMVATPVSITSPANTNAVASEVHLKYNHVFTILEFHVKGTGTLKAIELTTPTNPIAFSGGTINITQTDVAGTTYTIAKTGESNTVKVTLASSAGLNATTAKTVYMVINPSTYTGDYTINLFNGEFDGSTPANWKTMSKGAPVGGFKRGKKYIIEVDATAMVQESVGGVHIGGVYQGGKLAYILHSGDPGYNASTPHGLIAATDDQSTGIIWTKDAFKFISVATGTALGTGSANTTAIINQAGAGSTYAAGLARAYTGGGYSDWFLPSKDELKILWINKTAIGGLGYGSYWSSSEYTTGGAAAFTRGFSFPSADNSYDSKSVNYPSVRAVRAF